MRRLGLGALILVGVWLAGASAAWGNSITPMCTTAQGTQACVNGWYTTAVEQLSWTWSSGGTPGNCNEASYLVDTITTASCTVSWPGSVLTDNYTMHVEISSPTATATPSRPPDSGSWYNHSVTASVSGSSFSGIATCAPTTYSGPSSLSATVFGTCVDNAGKTVTVASAPFAYDTTPPSLSVNAAPGDRSVLLSWQTSGDIAPTASVSITRSRSGAHAAAAHVIYNGDANGFHDTHVRNGVRYQYTITALDLAGNASGQTVNVTPGPRLLAPAKNAQVNAPPSLSWTPIIGATYYNVQLYRGRSHKVLSTWPKQASLQLRPTWRFDGHRYHLKPGRYRWYVWPGFGRRSAADYGHMVGSGTFVVVP